MQFSVCLKNQMALHLGASQGFGRRRLTCGSLEVRVCCSPESLQPLIDTSSPPELCWSEHTAEHLFPNSPGGAVLTPNAHLAAQFPGRGQMAPSSPRPGQITRSDGLQVPPQAGRCHSPLTTLWWLPMFPPVKRQIVRQTALL